VSDYVALGRPLTEPVVTWFVTGSRASSPLDTSSSVKPILSGSMTTVGMRRHY
jgi:hypothetical protein